MKEHLRAITAILAKDLRGLMPLIILTVALHVAEPIIAGLDLASASEFWLSVQANFYWIGYALGILLLISVIQLDPANSLEHDWLTRPVARRDWLLAKLLFLLLTLWLPIVTSRIIANLGNGYGPSLSLAYALALELPAALLPVPLFFMIALLTENLRKALFLGFLVFMVFLIPAWDVSRPLFYLLGIDIGTDYNTMIWLQSLPMAAIGIGFTLLVFWLLYSRRQPGQATLAFCVAVFLFFFTVYTPTVFYGWDQVIAIHEAIINDDDGGLDETVYLEQASACFPAAPVAGNALTESGEAVLVQAGLYDEIVDRAGPDAVVLASSVRARNTQFDWITPSNTSRGIPVDWRVDRIRVKGRVVTGSNPAGFELLRSNQALNRFASTTSVDTLYWLVPGASVDEVASANDARLVFDYDIGLLSPTTWELPTDGRRHLLETAGSCRAVTNDNANTIEIDCIKAGNQPAMLSAQLVGVPASRVDNTFKATYKSDWLESISRKRYELTLQNPALVDSSIVLVTAYTVERILHKQLTTEGLFGGAPEACPSPLDAQFAAVEQSSWKDDSSHEVSSVAVERGVRVEVLDWRAQTEGGGRPVLFLLPGLGATAHSYDELAARLAGKYDVVAMTRRGTGDSSKPDRGYDIARLAQDVIQVIDTLGIDAPLLVGHSIGGEELSYLGARHPDRFRGLIYLDAAYDRTRNTRDYRDASILLPDKPPPRPSEFVSYEAAGQYALRTQGTARNIPEGEIMASYDFNTGAIRHNPLYMDAISMGLQAPDYASIPLPALGIFAMPTSPDSLMEAWYDPDDPAVRTAVEKLFELERATKSEQIERFRSGIAGAEVLVLDDASHWIFVSNEDDVLAAIDRFVERLR